MWSERPCISSVPVVVLLSVANLFMVILSKEKNNLGVYVLLKVCLSIFVYMYIYKYTTAALI